jgi:hypothetical protein
VLGSIACSSLGECRLKGISKPISVWRADRGLDTATRFEQLRGPTLTPLIGREGELDMLGRLWARACAGQGQVVLVSGEPGIGKSRLVETLRGHIASSGREGARRGGEGDFVFQCSPLRRNSALYPIVSRLRLVAGISESDDPATSLDRLERFATARGNGSTESLSLLADMLSIPARDRYPALDLSPGERKHRLLLVLNQLLRGTHDDGASLVLFEDLQWADPTSMDFLETLVASVHDTRVLVLITYRPPLQISWSGFSHVSQIALANLTDEQTVEMVRHLAKNEAVLESLVLGIAQRTDGVPLFIEEHTRAVLDAPCPSRRVDGGGKRGVVASEEIPITLRDALAARLDQLSSAREVAQQAAVVGRDFGIRDLRDLTGTSEDALDAALEQLVRAQIIHRRSSGDDARFSFKHSLVRDAAYQSLLKSSRRELHLRHARSLEQRQQGSLSFAPDVLAQHYLAGRAWHDAVRSLQLAIADALGKSANVEALHHIEAALGALAQIENEPQRDELELELVSQKGAALRAMEGYAAPQVEKVYRHARKLLSGLPDSPKRFELEWQQMQYFLVNGNLEVAGELAHSLLHLARERGENALVLDAHLANGMVFFHRGALLDACRYLEQGLDYYRPDVDEPRQLTHGQDAGVFTLSYLGYALWFRGQVSNAEARVRDAMAIAEDRQHAFSRVSALTFATRLAQCERDVTRVEPLAERLIDFARDKGFNYYVALGVLHRAWARAWGGERDALGEMMEGYRALEHTGTVLGLSAALLQIADASLKVGDLGCAAWALEQAESKDMAGGTKCWDSEVIRARAELAERRGSPSDAIYEEAIRVARCQGAGSLQLRAALSYARSLRTRGDSFESEQVLRPALQEVEPAGDGIELREARAMLASGSVAS